MPPKSLKKGSRKKSISKKNNPIIIISIIVVVTIGIIVAIILTTRSVSQQTVSERNNLRILLDFIKSTIPIIIPLIINKLIDRKINGKEITIIDSKLLNDFLNNNKFKEYEKLFNDEIDEIKNEIMKGDNGDASNTPTQLDEDLKKIILDSLPIENNITIEALVNIIVSLLETLLYSISEKLNINISAMVNVIHKRKDIYTEGFTKEVNKLIRSALIAIPAKLAEKAVNTAEADTTEYTIYVPNGLIKLGDKLQIFNEVETNPNYQDITNVGDFNSENQSLKITTKTPQTQVIPQIGTQVLITLTK